MERAPGLHDLSDERKASHASGLEARGALLQIDRLRDVLGDDEVGVARRLASRQRGDEVGDRPAFLGLEGIGERRHRRAVQPRAHRPEDVLAGRPAPEGPALREVCGADRIARVVFQRWRRRAVAPAERAVALDAAAVHVELLPELDGLIRGARRARERHGLRDVLGFREFRGEGREEVGDVRHFLVGEVGPGGHRRIRHAAPDDVHEVLMGRQRPVGRRTDLELARREVARPGAQSAAWRSLLRPPSRRGTASST